MAPDVPISTAPAPASRPGSLLAGRMGTDPAATARDGAEFGRLVDRDEKAKGPVEGDVRAHAEEISEETAADVQDIGAEASASAAIEPDWLEALLAEVQAVTRPKPDAPGPVPASPGATVAPPASTAILPLTVALEVAPGAEGGTVTELVANEAHPTGPIVPFKPGGLHLPAPGEVPEHSGKAGSLLTFIGSALPTLIGSSSKEGEAKAEMATAQPSAPAPTVRSADIPVPTPALQGADVMPAPKTDGAAPDLPAFRTSSVATPDVVVAPPAVASTADPSRDAPPLPVPLPRLRAELAREVKALVEQGRADMETRRQRDGSLTTEMELSPAELGRLRIILHSGERGLHVSVVVDRPESLEAVRRHLEGFHRSLMADGVTLDDVDIGAGGHRDERPDPRTGQRAVRIAPPDDSPSPPPPPRATGPSPAGRLDIRL